ncbi:MAG: response regulator [Gemmataceae bacterium]|nr:response regulator [Gemmataceae bacterium]
MNQEALIKRLMATFIEELDEHVRDLNRVLLEHEKSGDAGRDERLRALFRTAHSLKGAARSVNLEVIETACHQMEDVLAAARDRRQDLDAGRFALLFAAADALEEAAMRLREEHDLHGSRLEGLLPRLEEAADQATQAAAPRPDPVSRERARPEFSETASTSVSISEPVNIKTRVVDAPGSPVPELPAKRAEPAQVRVAADKLDTLLARTGELLVGRRRLQSRTQELVALRDAVGRWRAEWRRPTRTGQASVSNRLVEEFTRLERDLERLAVGLQADTRQLEQAAGALDGEIYRARMLPFAEACQGLDRLVRDLVQVAGKRVALIIEGSAVELDRSILDGLKDPLRHLVRNAIDHGIEAAEQRQTSGKPLDARLTVAAALRGNRVEVTVADDGRGLDLAALRKQARERGLPEIVDDREAADLVFLPGLSTAPAITDVSGRGVGMDAVKNRIEALHGSVDVEFTPGQGTRFRLSLPLTLSKLRVLMIAAGGQTFAFPSAGVQRLLRVDLTAVWSAGGRAMLSVAGVPLPVADLAATVSLAGRERAATGMVPGFIAIAGERRVVFLADEFSAEQEVVVKGLGARFRQVPHVSGATILPSGQIALVLNASALARSALTRVPAHGAPALRPQEAPKKKRILIAEDSVTTRTLQKTILESAGYEVLAAPDGAAAWEILQQQGADLLVSDVDMPRMDGFALTQSVRDSERFAELPVILMTSRASEQDRQRGVEVAADAYVVKSGFDQAELLATMARLL